jgi:hypothetical protein
MDGQTEVTGFGYDPSITGVTSVITRPSPTMQGTFFSDGSSYRTFADTDKIPIVQREPQRRQFRGGLLAAVVGVVALVVVLAGTALGLVQAGVIGGKSGTASSSTEAAGSTPHPSQRAVAPSHSSRHGSDLLTPASFGGAGAATYHVSVPAYGLTITSGSGRAWVSVAAQGQRPLFAGILQPHTSQHFTMLGSAQVEIGAGGTSMTVTSNHRTQTLQPPSAPFSYTLTTS